MITVISAWLSRSTRSVFASDRDTSIHLLILPIFVVVVLVLLAHIVRGITYDNRNLSLALALHTFCVCFRSEYVHPPAYTADFCCCRSRFVGPHCKGDYL